MRGKDVPELSYQLHVSISFRSKAIAQATRRTVSAPAPRVRAVLTATGAQFFLLPPYSPDMNPIEMAFRQV